jgi:MFS family permease
VSKQETDSNLDPTRWRTLFVVAIAQLMIVLDSSIMNIAIPSAKIDLGITDANQQWVITAYTLAFGSLLLLGGRIGDYMGRKKIFLIGLAGFAFASALGGIASTQGLLFASRALQGVFAALLAPAALAIISVTFTVPSERAKAFGVIGAISGGGAAIGLILGGVLTEYASWRWCLGVNTPIAIAAGILALRFVRESKAAGDNTYDIPGVITATAGLFALTYGFNEAAIKGWSDSITISFFVAAALLLVAFVVIESKVVNPLMPLRVITERNRGGSYLGSLVVGAGLFSMFLFLGLYLQVILGFSPLKSGFAFLPFTAGIIIFAGVASQLLPKVGPKPLMVPHWLLHTRSSITSDHVQRYGTGIYSTDINIIARRLFTRYWSGKCDAQYFTADWWITRYRSSQHSLCDSCSNLCCIKY